MERTWNAPLLGVGMYPVNFIGQAAISEQNTGWERTTVNKWDYNYEDEKELGEKGKRKWANAETEDGSLYVWIPRYTYRREEKSHLKFSDYEVNRYSIKFSNGTVDDTSDGYKSHPAFTFGKEELTGFWVSKFKAGKENESVDYKYFKPVSKPFKQKLFYSNDEPYEFIRAYNLNRTLNSHMMKTIEYSAMRIISISIGFYDVIHGLNSYETGVYGVDEGHFETPLKYGYLAAPVNTTRNIYGIYDFDTRDHAYKETFVDGVEDAPELMKVERKYRGVPKYSYPISYYIVLAIPPVD